MVMMLLWPLVATIVIELLVLRFLGESQRRVLWASVGMNILTNVPLNLTALYVADIWNVLVIGELLVIVVEACCYRLLLNNWQQSVIYSMFCNTISFLVGELFLLIFMFFTLY